MNRGLVIAAALGVAVAEVAVSLQHPVPIYAVSGGSMLVVLAAGLAAAWRRNGRPPAAFVVDDQDRSFRTPIHANGLLMALACLQLTVLSLAVVHETWMGLLGAGLFGGVLVAQWRAMRYGYGLTLRPAGIEAAKMAGTVTVPWEALAGEQPVRGDNWWEVRLAYARPELVTTTGWVRERAVVVFEGTDPGFVAAAIGAYAAEPGRRYAIGTRAELERLQALMPGPPPGILEVVEPASARVSARRLVVGLVMFAGALAVSGMAGWWRVAATPVGMMGARQIYLAVAGWRASRRTGREPESVAASAVSGGK